jgi:hypothetical protein
MHSLVALQEEMSRHLLKKYLPREEASDKGFQATQTRRGNLVRGYLKSGYTSQRSENLLLDNQAQVDERLRAPVGVLFLPLTGGSYVGPSRLQGFSFRILGDSA